MKNKSMLSMLQKKNKGESIQFAFTSLRTFALHTLPKFTRVPRPWKLLPSYKKRTFKIRDYNNQTIWTKNSNDIAGLECEAFLYFSKT